MTDTPFAHAVRWTALIALTGAMLALLSSAALPHSWYPVACCSDKDCAPEKGWRLLGTNYIMADGEVIPWSETKEGKDEDFHVCRNLTTKKLICAFRPLSGS